MRKLLLALFAALPAFAQLSATVSNVEHTSVHFTIHNPDVCYQIEYGTVAGTRPYTSQQNCNTSPGVDTGTSISGLAPSVKYYFVVNNYANGGPGSPTSSTTEADFTTLSEPGTHPEPAALPTTIFNPGEIDVSSYLHVPVTCAGGDNSPVAASDIATQPGWAGPIVTGDGLQTILDNIAYSVTVDFPKGENCKIHEQDPVSHRGYLMHNKTPDGNWIVLRTVPSAATDFPPYGVRTGPAWSANMAKLVLQDPVSTGGSISPESQFLSCYDEDCNHWALQNLEFTNSLAPYTNLLDVDPKVAFGFVFKVVPQAHTPNHFVVDRVYIHEAGWPTRWQNVISMGGDDHLITGTNIDIDFRLLGLFPSDANQPTVAGSVITLPVMAWSINPLTKATYTMTSPTTITVSGTGPITAWIDAATAVTNMVTVRYNGLGSATCGGGGCNVASGSETAPSTALTIMSATVASGTPTVTFHVNQIQDTTSWNMAVGLPTAIFVDVGDRKTIFNSTIHASGQTIYADANNGITGNFHDFYAAKNYILWPESDMNQNAAWGGFYHNARQPFELKACSRCLLDGMIFNGSQSVAHRTSGTFLSFPGAFGGPGTTDITVRNSTFKHGAAGYACAGGGVISPPDAPTAIRQNLYNNVFVDIDRDTHQTDFGAGLDAPILTILPGCSDLIFDHNTIPTMKGYGSSMVFFGGNDNNTSIAAEGFAFTNNFVGFTVRVAPSPMYCVGGQLYASRPVIPALDCTGDATAQLSSFSRRVPDNSGTTTPNIFFSGRNYIVGGYNSSAAAFTPNPVTYTDMSQSDITTALTGFPGTFTQVAGTLVADRLATCGYNATTYAVSGCGGADASLLLPAQGVVTGISVTPGANNLSFSYVAPDTTACNVDVSTDSGFASGVTRQADAGGATSRTNNITGLAGSTLYYYRVLCYFEQSTAMEFSGNQLTNGSATTGAGGAGGNSIGVGVRIGAGVRF